MFSYNDFHMRTYVSATDVEVSQAELRQGWKNRPESTGAEVPLTKQILEQLRSIWLMRPLGEG